MEENNKIVFSSSGFYNGQKYIIYWKEIDGVQLIEKVEHQRDYFFNLNVRDLLKYMTHIKKSLDFYEKQTFHNQKSYHFEYKRFYCDVDVDKINSKMNIRVLVKEREYETTLLLNENTKDYFGIMGDAITNIFIYYTLLGTNDFFSFIEEQQRNVLNRCDYNNIKENVYEMVFKSFFEDYDLKYQVKVKFQFYNQIYMKELYSEYKTNMVEMVNKFKHHYYEKMNEENEVEKEKIRKKINNFLLDVLSSNEENKEKNLILTIMKYEFSEFGYVFKIMCEKQKNQLHTYVSQNDYTVLKFDSYQETLANEIVQYISNNKNPNSYNNLTEENVHYLLL